MAEEEETQISRLALVPTLEEPEIVQGSLDNDQQDAKKSSD